MNLTSLGGSENTICYAQKVPVQGVEPVEIPDGADPFDYWIFRAGCSWGSAVIDPTDLLDETGNPQNPVDVARDIAEGQALAKAFTAYLAAKNNIPPNFTIVVDESPEISISRIYAEGFPAAPTYRARACWTVVARRTKGTPGDPGDIPVIQIDDVLDGPITQD